MNTTKSGRVVKPVKDLYLGNPKTMKSVQRLVRKDRCKDLWQEIEQWKGQLQQDPANSGMFFAVLHPTDSYETLLAERNRIGRMLGLDVDKDVGGDSSSEDGDDDSNDKTWKPKKRSDDSESDEESDSEDEEDDSGDEEEEEESEDEEEEECEVCGGHDCNCTDEEEEEESDSEEESGNEADDESSDESSDEPVTKKAKTEE